MPAQASLHGKIAYCDDGLQRDCSLLFCHMDRDGCIFACACLDLPNCTLTYTDMVGAETG